MKFTKRCIIKCEQNGKKCINIYSILMDRKDSEEVLNQKIDKLKEKLKEEKYEKIQCF